MARSPRSRGHPGSFEGGSVTFAGAPWAVRGRVRHVRGCALGRSRAGPSRSRVRPGPFEGGSVTFAGPPLTSVWTVRHKMGWSPERFGESRARNCSFGPRTTDDTDPRTATDGRTDNGQPRTATDSHGQPRTAAGKRTATVCRRLKTVACGIAPAIPPVAHGPGVHARSVSVGPCRPWSVRPVRAAPVRVPSSVRPSVAVRGCPWLSVAVRFFRPRPCRPCKSVPRPLSVRPVRVVRGPCRVRAASVPENCVKPEFDPLLNFEIG